MYRNAKNVGYYMIGKGALTQLGDLLTTRRQAQDGPAVFFLDHCFEGKNLANRLPVEQEDIVVYVDTTAEPTTDSVDGYTARVREFLDGRMPCALLAFGGGSTLDTRAGSWSDIPRPTKSPCPPCPARVRKPRAPASSAMRPKTSSWA